MANLNPEVLDKLSNIQQQIWQTVSLKVSEAADMMVGFNSPLTLQTPTSDVFKELGTPHLIIQFSLASAPENPSVILMDSDAYAHFTSYLKGEKQYDIDENAIADIRPALEAIVQGVCLAVGNIKNEPMVATGLAIRFQIFNAPPNMQKATELIRTQVAMSGDELNGSLTWLMDAEMAHIITGVAMDEDEEEVLAQAGPAGTKSSGFSEDVSSLELLMDIPLEIGVELGRVKMLVKDVIDLGMGSIIEIDKAAGEPVDVLVNGRLVARGEVVVIEDNFGVRLTEILTPAERLAKLNEVA